IQIVHLPESALTTDYHSWSLDLRHVMVASDSAGRYDGHITKHLLLFSNVEPSLQNAEIMKARYLPTLRHGTDFGLFLGFAVEAFGEGFVEERLFQFSGQ